MPCVQPSATKPAGGTTAPVVNLEQKPEEAASSVPKTDESADKSAIPVEPVNALSPHEPAPAEPAANTTAPVVNLEQKPEEAASNVPKANESAASESEIPVEPVAAIAPHEPAPAESAAVSAESSTADKRPVSAVSVAAKDAAAVTPADQAQVCSHLLLLRCKYSTACKAMSCIKSCGMRMADRLGRLWLSKGLDDRL